MSEHLYTYLDPPNERHLDQIVEALRSNGVIAVPTGTSWAFAADPTSKRANQRLRRPGLRNRSSGLPTSTILPEDMT